MLAPRALIVCPLHFEADALRPLLPIDVEVQISGPGSSQIPQILAAWAARSRGPVILAGVAGALNPRIRPGTAFIATHARVDGEFHPSPLASEDHPRIAITSTPGAVATPAAKAALAAATGADLVDLESETFARGARNHALRWAIVRGVSDGPDDTLPLDIDHWTTPDGRTRTSLVFRSLALRPWSLPALWRLGTQSRAALTAAGPLITSILKSL